MLPGECSSLDKQVAELQASEADLQKHKAELESKLEQLEELLASTTTTRDELQGRPPNTVASRDAPVCAMTWAASFTAQSSKTSLDSL